MESSKPLVMRISAGTVIRVFLIALVFLAAYKLQHLLLLVLTSVIIASAIERGTKAMARLRVPRLGSVLIIYASVFLLFFVSLSLLLPPLFNNLTELAAGLPAKLDAITQMDSSVDPLSSITGGLAKSFSLRDLIVEMQKFILRVSDNIFSTASVIFGGFFSFILILVISFYLSVQEKGIESFLRIVTPVTYENYVLDLWRRAQEKIGLWLQGQLFLGLIVGLTVFLGLWLMGIKYAITLGILAALFEIIPFFGPIFAAVPGVLLGFADGAGTGLFVLAFYIAVQQLENHVIYPMVVKKIVGVPPLVVILSLLVGAQLAGFLGMIIAVPLATILMELVNDFEKHKGTIREKKAKA